MAIRRAMMLGQKPGGLLPGEYQQVEYIQTDGYAFIDTGVYGDNDTSVKLDFQLLQTGDYFFFGARQTNTSAGYVFLLRGGTLFATAFDSSGNQALKKNGVDAPADTDRHIIYQQKQNAFLDGELRTSSANTEFTTPNTLFIFRSHHSTLSQKYMELKVFSCIIDDDGTVIRNFVPCYRKTDSEIGMYDTVNGVFYTNANSTGSFSIPS